MTDRTIGIGEVIWEPSPERIEASRLSAFRDWLRDHRGVPAADYPDLWEWSVRDPGAFWDAVRVFFDVIGDGFTGPALAEERMPGAVWYPDAHLNYAENVLRYAAERPDDIAVIALDEALERVDWTWRELEQRVAALANELRCHGVGVGDRVGAVLPNIPEAIVALLATASIGAIWTVSSPDLAPAATVERLRPLEPVVLIGTAGYGFKGKRIETLSALSEVAAELPTLRAVLLVGDRPKIGAVEIPKVRYVALDDAAPGRPDYVRVPFAHPLWVLFSSGTSGAPKGIVHGHGGIVLEHLKASGLQFGLGPGDRYYTAANTSWMVWNTLGSYLLVGAAVVTYAGAPAWPTLDRQFEIVAAAGVTMYSTGAAYLGLVERSGLSPADRHDLSSLHTIMSTGSVLAPSTWRWVHDAVAEDVHLSSDAGGTDICSGFIGGNPWQAERVGELQAAALGVAISVRRDDGAPAPVGEVGEMTITRPLPSMPVRFWNDPGEELYRAAYFAADPSVWTHGDWISETAHGGYIVHGRSDATLNRDGVRLGSADIYAALQLVPQVRNGVVLGVELPGGRYWMPLFVELADGAVLDDELRASISSQIRALTSARHVPDTIEAVPAIPMTHAGKRIEIPLKKLFLGHEPDRAVNRGSLANPDAVDWFVARAAAFADQDGVMTR